MRKAFSDIENISAAWAAVINSLASIYSDSKIKGFDKIRRNGYYLIHKMKVQNYTVIPFMRIAQIQDVCQLLF